MIKDRSFNHFHIVISCDLAGRKEQMFNAQPLHASSTNDPQTLKARKRAVFECNIGFFHQPAAIPNWYLLPSAQKVAKIMGNPASNLIGHAAIITKAKKSAY